MKLQSLALMTGITISGIVSNGAFVSAHAGTLLTSKVGYTGPDLNLIDYANGSSNRLFTFGPVSIRGGITFTSNAINPQSPSGSVLGQGYYDLGVDAYDPNGNGWFDGNAVYAGLDAGQGYMTFSFAAPVQSFGAFLNYAPGYGDNPTISTYDINNNLLSSFDLSVLAPISSPVQQNHFEFRGISENAASIASFRLGGSYIVASGSANGSPMEVPEPFTIVGTLVGGSAALRMRKKLKSSPKIKG
jgi:hypothetical protein